MTVSDPSMPVLYVPSEFLVHAGRKYRVRFDEEGPIIPLSGS